MIVVCMWPTLNKHFIIIIIIIIIVIIIILLERSDIWLHNIFSKSLDTFGTTLILNSYFHLISCWICLQVLQLILSDAADFWKL